MSAAAIASRPATAADFYQDKVLTILIGFPPGGSYDGYARLLSLHYGRYIAGNPKVIVEHRPGGGGRKAAGYFFTKAPTDGTMVAILPETLTQLQLMEPDRVRWDMRKVKFIGALTSAHSVFGVRKDTGVRNVKDALTKEFKVGCTGKASPSAQIPLLIKNLEGAKFTMVCGYRGSAPYMLAMERNEVNAIQMNWTTWSAKLKDKVASGEYIPLWQTGEKRGRTAENIPTIQEVIGTAKTKPVFEFVGMNARIGRSLVAPPGMPEARLAELKAAFNKLVKDKAFENDVKKRGFLFDPAPGEEVDATVKRIFAAPKDVVEMAAKAMKTGYQKGCVNCASPKKKK
jgi:tripartite-type tricarboxylate transporter receptor subunit TctC